VARPPSPSPYVASHRPHPRGRRASARPASGGGRSHAQELHKCSSELEQDNRPFPEKKISTDEQDDVLPVGRPRLLIYGVLFLAQHGLFDFIRAYTYLQCLSFLAEHGLFGVYFTA